MSSTPVEIVQAILQDPTNPVVVKPLVSPDAVYVSLSYDNPELKKLMPEDAKEAIGHGIRAKRSKSGAVSFDLLQMEAGRA